MCRDGFSMDKWNDHYGYWLEFCKPFQLFLEFFR